MHAFALAVFGRLPRPLRTLAIRILFPTFTAGVSVCFLDPDGRICLVQHSYSKGWGLPGGMMDGDETPLTTAQREMEEELALRVAIEGPSVCIRTPGRRHLNMMFVHQVTEAEAAAATPSSPEIVAVGWHPLDDLPDLAEFTDLFLTELGLLPLPER